MNTSDQKRVLITGGAKRIGKCITETLHRKGYKVIIHYQSAYAEACALAQQLNQIRPNSAQIIAANFSHMQEIEQLIATIKAQYADLSLLVNNASAFFPTPNGQVTEEAWELLFSSNVKGAFFLTQGLQELLRTGHGSVVNIADIHGQRPLQNYSVYCIAKAALLMQTKALAKELAPSIRVNGIAPGAILWPEGINTLTLDEQKKIIHKTLLQRTGTPEDIAQAVLFFMEQKFITGQTLAVDGGRSIDF